ncbi:hypothetical protein GLV94_00820 [Virgibacillus halodenitrificans]|jgi:hypothetical protein|nr:hypothetical protein [Virgibacillus halodenitrificans]
MKHSEKKSNGKYNKKACPSRACFFVCSFVSTAKYNLVHRVRKLTLKQWIIPSAAIIGSDYFVTSMASSATLRDVALLYKY